MRRLLSAAACACFMLALVGCSDSKGQIAPPKNAPTTTNDIGGEVGKGGTPGALKSPKKSQN